MPTDQSQATPTDPDQTGLPEQPDVGGPIGGAEGAREGPISERVGRDPGNLGDDVPAGQGDVTHPSPEPRDVQM